MKFILPLLLLCSSSVYVFAGKNEGEIRGTVRLDDQSPAVFASVVLLNAADTSFAGGTVAGEDGRFRLPGIAQGTYFAKASMVGYAPLMNGPFTVTASALLVELPVFVLQNSSREIGQVEVTAILPVFVQKPDMLVMNVEGSALRTTGSLYELLKRTPGVIIDQNGAISLRGKQGVVIMIDGKQTYLAGDQLNAMLKNMPAESVARVEIISNPSAKYDAQGVGGIINIVTKRNKNSGFNGSVHAGYGYGFIAKAKAGVRFDYGGEKWGGMFSYDWNQYNSMQKPQLERRINYLGTTSLFEQSSEIRSDDNAHNITTGYDFYPGKKITTGFRLSGLYNPSYEVTNTQTAKTESNQPGIENLDQQNVEQSRFYNPGIGIYLKKALDTTGRELSFNADYLQYTSRANTNFALHYYDSAGTELQQPEWQRNANTSVIQVGALKLDYVHPGKNGIKWETGLKSSYVSTGNDLRFENLQGSEWINDSLRTNDFTYTELINAGYVTASGEWKKWAWQGGLRVEQTLAKGYSETLDRTNTTDYLQFFPSVFVQRPVNENHAFNFSYSRRIDRPDYQELNPFVFYLDKYTYNQGNPFLKPSFTNALQLTHVYHEFLFTTVSYSHDRDAMMEVIQQIDSTNVSFQTTANLNTINTFALSVGFGLPVAKWWNVEGGIEAFDQRINSPLDGTTLRTESLGITANISNTFVLPKGIKAELSANYMSKLKYGMLNLNSNWALNASVSKSFLNEKLSVALSINDIFFTGYVTGSIDFNGMDVYINTQDETRVGWLTLRYNFGKQFEKKQTGYEDAAEDIKRRAGGK